MFLILWSAPEYRLIESQSVCKNWVKNKFSPTRYGTGSLHLLFPLTNSELPCLSLDGTGWWVRGRSRAAAVALAASAHSHRQQSKARAVMLRSHATSRTRHYARPHDTHTHRGLAQPVWDLSCARACIDLTGFRTDHHEQCSGGKLTESAKTWSFCNILMK